MQPTYAISAILQGWEWNAELQKLTANLGDLVSLALAFPPAYPMALPCPHLMPVGDQDSLLLTTINTRYSLIFPFLFHFYIKFIGVTLVNMEV